MAANNEPDFIVLVSRKCPHLGLFEDEKTWSATDQMQNYCHFDAPKPVEWSHQCQYCFCDDYSTCPILNAPQRKPKAALWRPAFDLNPKVRLPLYISLALVVLAVIGFGISKAGFPPLFQPVVASPAETQPSLLVARTASTPTSTRLQALATPVPSFTSTEKPEPSPTATILNTLPPQASLTPTATIYFTPTLGPELLTPFGTQRITIVHKVLPGESLEMLARIYETTEDVLRAANNIKPGGVLWVDVDIVVLPGLKDATNVQPLKAVYVEWKTTVHELAEKHKVTVDQLRADNGLSSDDFFPGKRWLVIPLVP